jgi:hypothetical protein
MIYIGSIILAIYLFRLAYIDYDGLGYLGIIYLFLTIFYVYIMNYTILPKAKRYYKFVVACFSIILIGVASFYIYLITGVNFDFHNENIIPLYYVFIITPMYIYFYIKRDNRLLKVNLLYLGMIVVMLYIYGTYGSFGNSNRIFEYYILNAIVGVYIVLFYLLSKITKDVSHKISSYFFVVVLVIRNLVYYIDNNSFLFEDSKVILVSLSVGLLMLVINLIFKHFRKEEDQIDNLVVQTLNLFLLIPVILMLSTELISQDNILRTSLVVLGIIGYRWLSGLKAFDMKYKKYFIIGLNIKILLIILGINLVYFDHVFSVPSDVMKFKRQ